jgi:hypothetical protein
VGLLTSFVTSGKEQFVVRLSKGILRSPMLFHMQAPDQPGECGREIDLGGVSSELLRDQARLRAEAAARLAEYRGEIRRDLLPIRPKPAVRTKGTPPVRESTRVLRAISRWYRLHPCPSCGGRMGEVRRVVERPTFCVLALDCSACGARQRVQIDSAAAGPEDRAMLERIGAVEASASNRHHRPTRR